MRDYIERFLGQIDRTLHTLSYHEVSKALNILHAVFERDGRLYVFGNGGSLALATHWVTDFNKTVFGSDVQRHRRRFQAIRVPTTEEELTAWANDVGFEMVFAGPLQNYLQDADAVIAISASGNSANVIKAVELAKSHMVPVIGISGFSPDNQLNRLADAKVHVETDSGEYAIVEATHSVVLHLMTQYFKDYFDRILARELARPT
jgi:D-sedoheptulose 7-phosphate isomerase